MAIINIGIDGSNMTPVNGQYTFTTTFIDTITGQLSTDNKYPQNQVYTTSTFTEPYFVPVTVADGNYTIGNIELRIKYKDITAATGLFNRQINCNASCGSLPITSISVINSSTLAVTLTSASTNIYNWRVLNQGNVSVATGVSNVTEINFNITIPVLPAGNYLLELTGSNCSGKSTKNFNVVAAGLPNCTKQPDILSILSSGATQLQFQFDAQGVFGISWRIKKGSVLLRSGVIKHTSIAQPGDVTFSNNSPILNYAALPADTYTLEIEGETCKSLTVSTMNFTVANVEVPLAFSNGSPIVTGAGNNHTMSISINKTGTYNTVILNTTTGVYHHNANVVYGSPFIKTGLPEGNYVVKVGTLETFVTIEGDGGGVTGELDSIFYYSAI